MVDIHDLAAQIETGGLAAVRPEIASAVAAARAAGLSHVLVDVLADPTQPEVARSRALALVGRALADVGRPARTAAA